LTFTAFAEVSASGSENKKGVREGLIKFFRKYYSANQMVAVAYGPHGLDEMIQKAVEIYSSVPDTKKKDVTYTNKPKPFEDKQ